MSLGKWAIVVLCDMLEGGFNELSTAYRDERVLRSGKIVLIYFLSLCEEIGISV